MNSRARVSKAVSKWVSSRAVKPALESLETRLLCARTPADPRPETLGKSFDLTERLALFARMTDLPAGTYKTLRSDLKAENTSNFDTDLLAYMRNRTGSNYFFNPADAGTIATYVNNNLSTSIQQTDANAVTDNRLFPASSSASYTVQLPDAINWNDASPSKNAEYLDTLNRQEWWVDLAQEYRYTGNSKYLTELQYELASWSYQNQTFTLPAKTSGYESYGFTMSIRVDNQVLAYFSVLGSSGWTGADNSLMLYKFLQQGDVLNTVAANLTDFTSNRSVSIGKDTQILGEVFPEFDNAAKWETTGRKTVFASIAAQFYADGSHREQSPGYTLLVLDDLLEDFQLDKDNSINWSADQKTTLTNSINALWQELSPDGKRPAIGDTYRLTGIGDFTKAQLALGENDWPDYKAGERDGWVFGTDAVNSHLHDSTASTTIGPRGDSYSLPDSGNYILRSDDNSTARQINYIAGPKGGDHGHYDYMSFELWGYGRPLIADPGPYIYGTSASRAWAVSAAAHNTIAVAGVNPADLENSNAILNSGISSVAGGSMLSSTYQGYSFLDGDPTLSRSIWYDGNNTMVIVDFASSSSAQNYETGFTLENQNSKVNLANGTIYTQNSSGGNVRIQSLLGTGQGASVNGKGVFTSNTADDPADPATRYQVQQNKTTFAVFATVITAYNGSAATATNNVSWVSKPTKAGQSAVLSVNGTDITFSGPAFATVGKNGQTRGTYNDVAYDSTGRLHMVFYDRDTNNLKYAVRDTNGVWSNIQTIDGGLDDGYNPSLVIDKNNMPHVAYQDGNNSDLKYAYLDSATGAWQVETVDVKGSTGGYPSLVMTRNNTAAISYYNKTNGDLRLATQGSNGWIVQTIDSGGDVGRFSSLQLDPNRSNATKFAVAYEDTTHGTFKYALQSNAGYIFQTIDAATTIGGGYTSMKFYATGNKTGVAYAPAVSYYDAGTGHLKYAVSNGVTWAATFLANRKRQGLYSELLIVNNTPSIFFFDGTNNDELFLSGTKISGGKWTLKNLGDGGRQVHAAVYKGKFTYTNLNEATGYLTVAGA